RRPRGGEGRGDRRKSPWGDRTVYPNEVKKHTCGTLMTPCGNGSRQGSLRGVMRLRPWVPALAWAAVLFVLSSIPGDTFPRVPGWHADKVVHVALYLLLGLFCARALRATKNLSVARLVFAATMLATAYGVADEVHQLFTPRRSCDWRDVVADAVGAFIGAVLLSHRSGKITPAV